MVIKDGILPHFIKTVLGERFKIRIKSFVEILIICEELVFIGIKN